jgi:hypothetical protein
MIKFHSFASFSPIFDEEIIEFMSTALKTVFKNTAAKLNLFFYAELMDVILMTLLF